MIRSLEASLLGTEFGGESAGRDQHPSPSCFVTLWTSEQSSILSYGPLGAISAFGRGTQGLLSLLRLQHGPQL